MIKLKDTHAENTALVKKERPQNKHLKPPWKPGESGNPGGRPKRVLDAINEELNRVVTVKVIGEDGVKMKMKMPRYREMAIAQVDNACSIEPHSVNAFRSIRELVEPTDKEESELAASELHTTLLSGFLRLAQMKSAEATEA